MSGRMVGAEEARRLRATFIGFDMDREEAQTVVALMNTVVQQAEQIAAVLKAADQIEAASDERLRWISGSHASQGDVDRWEAVANAQMRAATKIRSALGVES